MELCPFHPPLFNLNQELLTSRNERVNEWILLLGKSLALSRLIEFIGNGGGGNGEVYLFLLIGRD